MKFLILLTVAFFCFTAVAETNWYASALKEESSGSIHAAIEDYRKADRQGVNEASFALGRIYRDVLFDDQESFKWFLRSANQGNVFAQYEIGLIYLNGSGLTEANSMEAKRWFTLAVKKKHGQSAFELFKMASDPDRKFQYLKIASEQGVLEAMKNLKNAYENGLYGASKNSVESERLGNLIDKFEKGQI